MMANLNYWPNCNYDYNNFIYMTSFLLPINKPRTKANLRVGPHNKEVLYIINCGMLGDFWADNIPGKLVNSTRFQVEQGIINSAYIHYLTLYFYNLGYCSRPMPFLVKKTKFNSSLKTSNNTIENLKDNKDIFNYRLTLFTFSSFN